MNSKSGTTRVARLRQLFMNCTRDQELRRILHELYGAQVTGELPGTKASMSELAFEAVLCLEQRGLIDGTLFEALAKHAPGRLEEIREVSTEWNVAIDLEDEVRSLVPKGLRRVDVDGTPGSPEPKRFFLGHPPTWADLAVDADVRRKVDYNGELLQYERFTESLSQPLSASSGLVVVFGEGGSGKTTFLRRLMFDLTRAGNVVLRYQEDASLDVGSIVRYVDNGGERGAPVFIFIDDAQHHASRLFALARELTYIPGRAVVVAAARRNEWNQATHLLRPAATYDSVLLPRLDGDEAKRLIESLARNDALGSLKDLSEKERLEKFTIEAESQLLVGLLEATQGKRFRDIVVDEFRGIANTEVKALYLAICVFAQLGLRTPEGIASLIAKSDSHLSFSTDILPLLEFVISREEMSSGFDLSPRHRVIADELVRRVCGTREARWTVCLDALDRMSAVRRAERRVQGFAAKVGQRMLRNGLIGDSDEAMKTVDAILAAGVGEYQWGQASSEQGHTLRRQSASSKQLRRYEGFYQAPGARPSQNQFRAGGAILRRLCGDDDAVFLIREGLGIDERWGHLRLDWAIIEFERGDVERAEQVVADVIAYQVDRLDDISLPVPLAVDIALLKRKTDHEAALKYLELAEDGIHRGMDDSKMYFLHLGQQYENVGRVDDSIAAFQKGLDFVRGPVWAIEGLERALTHRLSTHKPEEFVRWVESRYGARGNVPYYVLKEQVKYSVASRDAETLERIWKSVERGKDAIADVVRGWLEGNDNASVDYVVGRVDLGHLPDDILRLVTQRYIGDKDQGKLKDFCERSERFGLFLTGVARQYANRGDFATLQFLGGIMPGAVSLEEIVLAQMRLALEAGDVAGIKEIEEQLRQLGELSPRSAKDMMDKAIQGRSKTLAAEILRHVKNPAGLARSVQHTHLKGGRLDTLAFLDEVFGRQSLEPWVIMRLLHSAMIERNDAVAIDVCRRTTEVDSVFSMLRKELKTVDVSDEEFLERVNRLAQKTPD